MEVTKPQEVSDVLWQFAKFAYANHDEAHRIDHAVKVLENGREIVKRENIQMNTEEAEVLVCVLLMHDARDHKQKNCVDARTIYGFYVTEYGKEWADIIVHIHENCSWSKRHDSKSASHNDWMRKLLQDADWLESMGETALRRCTQYQTIMHPEASESRIKQYVVDHIHEKMIRIHRHLNYATSRLIVQERDLVTPLQRFLQENDITTD